MHQELVVADGATGATKRKIATPGMPATGRGGASQIPHLGNALYLLRLSRQGLGAADLVLKDRYWHFWVFDDQLEPFGTAAAIRALSLCGRYRRRRAR